MPKPFYFSMPNQLNEIDFQNLSLSMRVRLRPAPLPLGVGGKVTSSLLQFTSSLIEDDGGCPQVAPEPIRL